MLRTRIALAGAVALGSFMVLTAAPALADGHTSSKDMLAVPQEPQIIDIDEAPIGSLKDVEIVEAASPFYIGLRGGVGFVQNTDFDALGVNVVNEYDQGSFLGSLAIGYDLKHGATRGFRAELELGGSRTEIEAHNVGGTLIDGDAAFGDTTTFYGFANIYYDLGFGGRTSIYGGLGIGFAHVNFSGHGENTVGIVMDNSATSIAYQVMAGISYRIADRMHIDVGYTYQAVTGIELTAVDYTQSSVDLDTHAMTVGLRFSL